MISSIQYRDDAVNIDKVLLWSDNKAEKLTALVLAKQKWYEANIHDFVTDWHRAIFNVDTATIEGLNVWANILGLGLTLDLEVEVEDQPTFGFRIDEDYQPFSNYNHGNFTARNGLVVNLTIEQARILIKLQYLKLIARPSVPYINRMLNIAFGYRQVHVLDGQDMTFVTYVFGREPGRNLRLMVDYYDLLPRPSCVGIRIVVDREGVFGFSKVNENYHDANFITEL